MKKGFRHLLFLFAIIGFWRTNAQAQTSGKITAVSSNDFLNSIGVNTHICQGQSVNKLIAPLKYIGVRALRDGGNMLAHVSDFIMLHQKTGIKYCIMDIDPDRNIATAKQFAAAGALLAIEGPNEPNNWPVIYKGEKGGGNGTWLPLAKFQRDLYSAAKNDSILKNFPVFGPSEMGASTDNVGLQYLTIPQGANTLMADGTVYADFVNVHNYATGHIKGIIDNQSFKASSNKDVPAIDGLYGNHGNTWRNHFKGYSENALATIPKVTTETGWKTDNTSEGDDLQGKVLLNVFLDQFKAGWKYTFIYEMIDDRDGAWGFYKSDYITSRKAATYLHNFTTILADTVSVSRPDKLYYSITDKPETTHDLLLQKSNGQFELVVWNEKVIGSDKVIVNLGHTNRNINIYDPTIGTTATRKLQKASSVTLSLKDHPIIIEINN